MKLYYYQLNRIFTAFAVVILSLFASIPTFAQSVSINIDGINYTIDKETNKAACMGGKIEDTNLIIPEYITYENKEYPVCSIESNAFANCPEIELLVIPNNVTTIRSNAFNDCGEIKTCIFGSSLVSISRYSFNRTNFVKIIWLGNTPPTDYYPNSSVSYASNSGFKEAQVYPFLSSYFEVDGIIYVPVSPSERTCDIIDCRQKDLASDLRISDNITNKGINLKIINVAPYSFYKTSGIKTVEANNNGHIGDYAFYECPDLESVKVGNNGYIGVSAFEGCKKLSDLKAVNTGDIKDSCFKDCISLFSAELTNRGKIGAYAFANCVGAKKYNFGDGINAIGGFAFYNNSIIENISLSNNIQKIGKNVFQKCESLRTINLSEKLDTIPEYAFSKCSSLENITVPKSVLGLMKHAFEDCVSLKTVIFDTNPDNELQIGENGAENYFTDCPLDYVFIGRKLNFNSSSPFSRNQYLQTVVFDDVEDTIYPYEFYECSNLRKITLSKKTKKIGEYAFGNASLLDDVDIPDSVKEMGCSVFSNCSNLSNVKIGKGLSEIPESTFEYCGILNSITIPYNIEKIANKVFNGCRSLQTVIFEDNKSNSPSKPLNLGNNGVDTSLYKDVIPLFADCYLDSLYIGRKLTFEKVGGAMSYSAPYSPFKDNRHLRSVVFNDEEDEITDYEFSDCRNLTSCTYGSGIKYIGNKAFFYNNLKEFEVSDNVTYLGREAFSYCGNLEKVRIGKSLRLIRQSAFKACTNLKDINFPSNLIYIGEEAFASCASLKNIVFEESNSRVKEAVFYDYVYSTDSKSTSNYSYKIDVKAGDELFFEAYSPNAQTPISISINSQIVDSFYGSGFESRPYLIKFDKDQVVTLIATTSYGSTAKLRFVQLNPTSLMLASNGVDYHTMSHVALFADLPLETLIIGRKIIYDPSPLFGYSPFYRNTTLSSVTITDEETEIYENEFYGCSGLKQLSIGNGVKNIGNWAFSGCSSLEFFSVGSEAEKIGNEAFSDCTKLKELYTYSLIPPLCGDQTLDDINKWDCTLFVPFGCQSLYQEANQWKDFFFIKEMDAVLVDKLTLNLEEVTLSPSSSVQLSVQVLPANATDKTLIWSSSNPEIASVNSEGLVTALMAGTTTIIVKSADGNSEATCLVTVDSDSDGIESVVNVPHSSKEVYNLNGYKVSDSIDNLAPGIYIVREGAKVRKILVKKRHIE